MKKLKWAVVTVVLVAVAVLGLSYGFNPEKFMARFNSDIKVDITETVQSFVKVDPVKEHLTEKMEEEIAIIETAIEVFKKRQEAYKTAASAAIKVDNAKENLEIANEIVKISDENLKAMTLNIAGVSLSDAFEIALEAEGLSMDDLTAVSHE